MRFALVVKVGRNHIVLGVVVQVCSRSLNLNAKLNVSVYQIVLLFDRYAHFHGGTGSTRW
jgi:hypothetical protein